MNRFWIFSSALFFGFVAASAQTHSPKTAPAKPNRSSERFPGRRWEYIARDEQKQWSAEKLAIAKQYSESLHDSSVVIEQGGRLVAEWGDPAKKITTFSVRKSLISALYGIYSANGVIDINETLAQAGVDDQPFPLTQEERKARIVDLLRARSGVYHAVDFETDYQRKTRPTRGSHAPGSFWFYNNWDFNALGTIFEKKTGLKIGDAFYQSIAKPIGMQDFKPSDVYYVGDGSTSEHRAYMFEMSALDMARFGQLYLSEGRWKSRQIIPAAWVEKSSHTSEMVNDGHMDQGGYEYLWWVEHGGIHMGEATLPGMYSAQGAGGHYILIVPSLDLVVVNQFDNEPLTRDSKAVLLAAQNHHAIFDEQFHHLLKRILDSRIAS